MKRRELFLSALALPLAASASPLRLEKSMSAPTLAELTEQLRQTEVAFAKTMADRDHAAFASFISDEAIFINGRQVLRGKAAIVSAWKGLYADAKAPFSWTPDLVEVLDSGSLGHSEGPVTNAKGEVNIRFSSVWRRESDGSWKIVFDQGYEICHCEKQAK